MAGVLTSLFSGSVLRGTPDVSSYGGSRKSDPFKLLISVEVGGGYLSSDFTSTTPQHRNFSQFEPSLGSSG